MVSGSLVLGYHGCDKSLAEKVISGQEQLWRSERPWDWLGHGERVSVNSTTFKSASVRPSKSWGTSGRVFDDNFLWGDRHRSPIVPAILALRHENVGWLGNFERCFAWAVLENAISPPHAYPSPRIKAARHALPPSCNDWPVDGAKEAGEIRTRPIEFGVSSSERNLPHRAQKPPWMHRTDRQKVGIMEGKLQGRLVNVQQVLVRSDEQGNLRQRSLREDQAVVELIFR